MPMEQPPSSSLGLALPVAELLTALVPPVVALVLLPVWALVEPPVVTLVLLPVSAPAEPPVGE